MNPSLASQDRHSFFFFKWANASFEIDSLIVGCHANKRIIMLSNPIKLSQNKHKQFFFFNCLLNVDVCLLFLSPTHTFCRAIYCQWFFFSLFAFIFIIILCANLHFQLKFQPLNQIEYPEHIITQQYNYIVKNVY